MRRVLLIAREIESRTWLLPVDVLAVRHGVTRRTIFRDLAALRDVGYRVPPSHSNPEYRREMDTKQDDQKPLANIDDEVAAIRTVLDTLVKLPPESRTRVLMHARDYFNFGRNGY